eukprot:TRINITY_DN27737_c0_g2_i1.p1 TRINITY_DN27737_c0_g2~~TRINITY_DN27737_c0_g2_i1.p1  ORF type:complete len:493 (-),score=70.10 TRINITY_DN27737_c0_g2_i1:93-1571(-)
MIQNAVDTITVQKPDVDLELGTDSDEEPLHVFPNLPEDAKLLECCSICLEPMSAETVTLFLASGGCDLQPASCRHFCHLRCAKRLHQQRCPVCRVHFAQMRRITRDGLLGMSALELDEALRTLHGQVTATTAAELFAALFPISTTQTLQTLKELEESSAPYYHHDELPVPVLARMMWFLSKTTENAVERPLAFYLGYEDSPKPSRHAYVQRRFRRGFLYCCSGFGGATNGLVLGLLAGVLGGFCFRQQPPLTPDVDDALKEAIGGGGSVRLLDTLGHIVDILAPWHMFGSAILAILAIVLLVCLSVLLSRCFLAPARVVQIIVRFLHRALWLWTAARLGSNYTDEEIGRHLWLWCSVVCGLAGALAGFACAMRALSPTLCRRFDTAELLKATKRCFRAGLRATDYLSPSIRSLRCLTVICPRRRTEGTVSGILASRHRAVIVPVRQVSLDTPSFFMRATGTESSHTVPDTDIEDTDVESEVELGDGSLWDRD